MWKTDDNKLLWSDAVYYRTNSTLQTNLLRDHNNLIFDSIPISCTNLFDHACVHKLSIYIAAEQLTLLTKRNVSDRNERIMSMWGNIFSPNVEKTRNTAGTNKLYCLQHKLIINWLLKTMNINDKIEKTFSNFHIKLFCSRRTLMITFHDVAIIPSRTSLKAVEEVS